MANGGSVIFKFEGDTSDLEKSTKKTESALGTLAKSFTIAQVASNALNKGIQLISSNLDDAISRFDTMNNFPKVMKNLGIEGKDAEKAINKLSDGLLGLPTALDESVSYVQRFTATNDDLDKSADIFLAINNAILAGGASAQTQASAMEQFAQVFSKGRFDMMEWRTLLTAMPAQLKQVATSMGMTVEELGAGLRQADKDVAYIRDISIPEFTDVLLKLNKEGINGMASFEQQAKSATGGIATSFKNAKTAIVRNITNIIDKIDDGAQQYGGISGIITKITEKINKGISFLGDILVKIVKQLPNIINLVKKLSPLIASVVAGLVSYKATLIAIKAINFISTLTGTISAFISLIPAIKSAKDAMLLLNMAFNASPIGIIVGLIGALTVGGIALAKSFEVQTEEEKKNSEALKQLADDAENAVKSYDDLRESQQQQIDAQMTELNGYETLWEELQTLVDENGKVKEGYEQRASFIMTTLSNAFGIEIKDINGVIDKYDELKNSINDVIEKKKAQIVLEAQEELWKEAIREQTKVVKERIEAEKKLKETKEKVAETERQLFKTIEMQENEKSLLWKAGYAVAENITKKELELAWQDVDNAQKAYDSKTDLIEKYAYDIGQYQKNMELFQKQEYDKMQTTEWEYVQEYQKAGDAQKAELEDRIKNTQEHMDILKNLKEKEGTDLYDQQIANDEKLLTSYKENLKKYENATETSLDNTKGIAEEGVRGIATTVTTTAEEELNEDTLYGVGENVTQGLIRGMNSGARQLRNTASGLASIVASNARATLDEHSPSKVFFQIGKFVDEGFANGINAGARNVLNSMKSLAQSVAPSMSGVLGDVFDLSPTLNNTTSSSSNVTVKVYNNMETDFMGNLVNNIKTFSNGSKNDYNYGMS